jgi:PKD repeat protein
MPFTQAVAQQNPGIFMERLASYNTGQYNVSACEVVAYDATTRRAFLLGATAAKLTVISLANPSSPAFLFDIVIDTSLGSGINSVACRNGIVAVAVEANPKTNPGRVAFYDVNGAFQGSVQVGNLPDMITFSPDGTRVLTANEGEPSGYNGQGIDPEGSISIINIAGGVQSATVQTATFTAFNNQAERLRAMGVRLYGPNATVAQDLEPEYIAFADSNTAYVTLQENNAFAVVNINTATVTEILPLGQKDWSKGQPTLNNYTFPTLPLLGNAGSQPIYLGGFSGLIFDGYAPNGNLRFITHPDRGPNGEPATLGTTTVRPFAIPTFQTRIVRFELNPNTGAISLTQQIMLTRKDGTTPISGLPNLQAGLQGTAYTDEIPVDLNGNILPNDPMGADLEGIVRGPDNTFWMVDEYRPAIYNFDTNGRLIERYVPAGTAAAGGQSAGFYGVEAIPAVFAQRRANRGFEAVAREGNKLYAFIQSSIDNPDLANDNNSRNGNNLRILEFDLNTKTVIGQYIYPIFERQFACDKIGDATSLGNGKFMVLERDDATGIGARKYMMEINLKGATNIHNQTYTLPGGKTIEQCTLDELATANIRPVFKRKYIHLPSIGYDMADKVEGLTMIDSVTFAVLNDNDFSIGGSTIVTPTPNGTLINLPGTKPIVLGVIKLNRANGLDASDRDGAGGTALINIRNQPVYGNYMPDAVASFRIDGRTYFVTANEGDTRADWPGYNEERRVGDAAYLLDPAIFPNAAALKNNANLGRMVATIGSGDIDRDGRFDEIHGIGTRSMAIWTTEGNLVYDSGEEFERITSQVYPANFNATHTSNAMDSRSPSKGPEPEAAATGVIDGRTYAFIGNERIGGVMAYNVSTPTQPRFEQYVNARNFAQTPGPNSGGDLGPETITFVPRSQSPNGRDLLLVSNEVSGSLSIFQVSRLTFTAVIDGGKQTACPLDGITFTGNADSLNVTEWRWNFGDGSAEQTVRNVVKVFCNSGTFPVKLTVTLSNGQKLEYSQNITVSGTCHNLTPLATNVNLFGNAAIRIASSSTRARYQLFRGGARQGAEQDGTGDTLILYSNQLSTIGSGTYTVVGRDIATNCTYTIPGSATIASNGPLFNAEDIAFDPVTNNSIGVECYAGNGNGRIILCRQGAPCGMPNYGETFTGVAGSTFQSAPGLVNSPSTKVVAELTGTAGYAVINGLQPGTMYHFFVAEYRNISGQRAYNLRQSTAFFNPRSRMTLPRPAANSSSDEVITGLQASVYPNPAAENINIMMQSRDNAVISVQITDALGKVIESVISGQELAAGSTILPVSVQNLPQGIYSVQILMNGTLQSIPFTVIR